MKTRPDSWEGVLDTIFERRHKDARALRKSMGKPDTKIGDRDYFKVKGGVVSLIPHNKGKEYYREEAITYDNDFIKALSKLVRAKK